MLERDIREHLQRPSGLSGDPGDQRDRPDHGRDLVAEIGDVTRFPSAAHCVRGSGLTPKHHESDIKMRRGQITKQGSRLVRWAVIEGTAAITAAANSPRDYRKIAERRGKNKATVAIARKVLTLVYYGLRDGEIRCLAQPTPREARTRPDASSKSA